MLRRALPGLLLILLALAWPMLRVRGDGAAAPAPASVTWRDLERGAQVAEDVGAGFPLALYRFDLRHFRAEVIVKGKTFERQRADEVLRGVAGAVAVVNGGFFDEKGRPLGLRIARGAVVVPLRPRVDWGVLTVGATRARIVHSKEFSASPDIEAAIQVGPRILVDGVVPGLKPQVARRTVVALGKDGAALTLVVVPEPVEAGALGARLAALGFHSALMLDGGPSTQLAVRAASSRRDIAGGYGVPDLLALVRR